MAKKKTKNKKPSAKYKKYTIAGGKAQPKASCPKCGPGNFLSEHKNRQSCGSCGYTVFRK